MNIGIDVDNTITDTLPVLKKYCKEYNDKVIKRNLTMNEEGFAVANLYDWTEDEKTDFLNSSDLLLKDNINAGYAVPKKVSNIVNPSMIKSNKICV